jgi:hypothetical protein
MSFDVAATSVNSHKHQSKYTMDQHQKGHQNIIKIFLGVENSSQNFTKIFYF